MHDRDSLHRFMFEDFPIRGQLVHLDAAWRALIEHRDYPAAVRDTLGQAVAASLLLAATIKFKGVLSLQLQGDGPVHLMLVQCTDSLGVRGLARYREGVEFEPDIGAMCGNGNLTVTLETEDAAQRYQGIVPITGERLAGALQLYFENSEQLPTRLWLHADANGASGMLLQKLPAESAAAHTRVLEPAAVEDAWRRVQLIGDTLTLEELRTLADQEILHRLFNEDDVRLFEPAPVFFSLPLLARTGRGHVAGLGRERNQVGHRGARRSRGAVRFLQSRLCLRPGRRGAAVQRRRAGGGRRAARRRVARRWAAPR